MPLNVLLIIIVGGIAAIALLLHLLGKSRLAVLTQEDARSAWHRHFPDDEILDLTVAHDGHAALVQTSQGPGLLWSFGADTVARHLRDFDLLEEPGQLAVIIVAGDGWHPGVLGIIASRLKERFNRPAIALGFDDKGQGTGSARSITGVDLGLAVRNACDQGLLVKGGGHAMAAGMTIERGKLGDFRAFMEHALADQTTLAIANAGLSIDGALSAGAANLNLIELLERAGPYGAGNPKPRFAFPAHRITYADYVGTGHIRCTLVSGDGARLKAIAFRAADGPLGDMLVNENHRPLHIAGTLARDDWGGRQSVQLFIDDAAEPVVGV